MLKGTEFSRQLFATATAMLVLAVSAPAFAAETEVIKAGKDTARLEEVIVTAERRAENLQKVSVQVTAFTAAAIENANIKSTQDYINLTPNISLDSSDTYNNTFVVVRGVTQINNADAPVAIIVDGVPQNNQKQFNMNLFDIERIEVLKGPQGALYGRNAIGGAINIITKAPTNDFEGFGNASFGRGNALNVSGGVSGPIVKDKVMFRLAGDFVSDDGRIRNTFADKKQDTIDHDYTLRGRVTAEAADWLELDFRGSYRDFRAGSQYDSAVFSGDANDFVLPQLNLLGQTWGDQKEFTFKFDAQLKFATLTGITGYTDISEINRGDLDFRNPVDSPGGFFGTGLQLGQGQDLDVKLFSQELRLTSPDDQRLRWIAGVYYIHTDRKLRTRGFVDFNGSYSQIDNPALVLIDRQEDNNNNAYAVFGQLDYDITNDLKLSAGLRYDRDERKQTNLVTNTDRSKNFDSTQPKVTLTYNFSDEKLVYATYSTGFRSGGFNAPGVVLDEFKDETLKNYEVGFKTSWADRRFILNGAAYYSKVNNFQLFFVEAASASQIISNIDDVEIHGLELEAQALVTPDLQLFAGLGTTDSKIKKLTVFPGNDGNHTPKTTKFSVNAGIQYTPQITGALNGFFRLDYEHRGKRYWQVDNVDVQHPLDFLNVRVGVQTEKYGLFLWGKNITGEKYYTDFNPREFSGLDIDIGFRGEPATYGIEARARF